MRADIMFLVDSSGSIGDTNFETMKTFMKNLVGKIQIGANKTQVGVVQFSDYNREEFQLNTFFTHEEIYAAIDAMSPIYRNTLTGSALTFVNEYFDLPKGGRPQVRKFLILLTDGKAQDEVGGPAMAVRNRGVTIFSVGVYGANRAELEEISGDGSLVFHVENFDHLKEIESKLIFRVCALHGKCPCLPSRHQWSPNFCSMLVILKLSQADEHFGVGSLLQISLAFGEFKSILKRFPNIMLFPALILTILDFSIVSF